MELDQAVAFMDSVAVNYSEKNAVPRGFDILAKYGNDLDVSAEHDVIYAGQGDITAMVAQMTEADLRDLAVCGWAIDTDYECWRHFV